MRRLSRCVAAFVQGPSRLWIQLSANRMPESQRGVCVRVESLRF
ncbi:hypothetical protein LMG1873_04819 [Achromobacter piechaudii]|uniref:Uncharacterized protein n=1 Tax=Achromobacter piechaudii TaxID=72556 RepID=A0ABN7F5A3_9BURK|nr:hypothetical protein LMG1873_04819 [Achromobacter piechaudii]